MSVLVIPLHSIIAFCCPWYQLLVCFLPSTSPHPLHLSLPSLPSPHTALCALFILLPSPPLPPSPLPSPENRWVQQRIPSCRPIWHPVQVFALFIFAAFLLCVLGAVFLGFSLTVCVCVRIARERAFQLHSLC